MPPPGYEPFLRAICENPEDDTVRLVYADWLDEHGDPDRAEFIRCQIACNANPHKKNPVCRRAEVLRKANSKRWRGDLAGLTRVDWGAFDRGFVALVKFKGSWAIHELFTLVAQMTPIQEITLTCCDPHTIHELVRAAHFAHIRRLESRDGYASDASIEALAGSQNSAALETLILPAELWTVLPSGRGRVPVVTDRGAVALAESPYLTRLRQLTFSSAHFSSKGVQLLRQRFGSGFKCDLLLPTPPPAPLSG